MDVRLHVEPAGDGGAPGLRGMALPAPAPLPTWSRPVREAASRHVLWKEKGCCLTQKGSRTTATGPKGLLLQARLAGANAIGQAQHQLLVGLYANAFV